MELEPTGHRISPQALTSLLKQHGRGLEVYAAQWSLTPEDCVQEAFVKLAAQSPPPENCVAWLFQVTRNFAISSLRSQVRRTNHESTFASWVNAQSSESADPACRLEAADSQDQLLQTLNSLDESDRELIVMRIWSGLTWSQIAALTDSSSSSAHRRYVAAIEKIKIQLEVKCLTKPS